VGKTLVKQSNRPLPDLRFINGVGLDAHVDLFYGI
jgi:hypothetical protein